MDEVAEILAVSRATVWNLITAGDLRSVKLGKLRRVRDTDLQTYVNNL